VIFANLEVVCRSNNWVSLCWWGSGGGDSLWRILSEPFDVNDF
jgi:hypothetical protein